MEYTVQYDHINKRLIGELHDQQYSVSVTITGTKHAAISAAEVVQKTSGKIPAEAFVRALKKYRNNNGKSFIVYLNK